MNLGLQLSRQFSNRWIFFLQPFPHCGRILFVRSSHRLLRGQTPGSQIASPRPHRNLQIEFSRQQILHRFPRPQCKGQVQLVRTTTDNVAHRRGCLMWCQSRNWRPSSTSRFQRSTSYAFHQPPPAAHRTSSYPENPSRLGLRKTFLNGLNGSPAKVFLSFRRQRASILFSHARHATTLPSECHLYYAPISNSKKREGSGRRKIRTAQSLSHPAPTDQTCALRLEYQCEKSGMIFVEQIIRGFVMGRNVVGEGNRSIKHIELDVIVDGILGWCCRGACPPCDRLRSGGVTTHEICISSG